MTKKTILGTLIFALICSCSCFLSTAVHAEEINQGAIEIPDDSGYTETEPINLGEEDYDNENENINSEANDDTIDINAITGGRNAEDNTEIESTNIDDNSSTINLEELTEVEEPSIWPMVISLSALGLVIVIIIVLNLFGRRKK